MLLYTEGFENTIQNSSEKRKLMDETIAYVPLWCPANVKPFQFWDTEKLVFYHITNQIGILTGSEIY